METTVGRVIFNDHLPKEIRDEARCRAALRQRPVEEEGLGTGGAILLPALWSRYYRRDAGRIKKLGFLYATRAGISIGIDDLVVPGKSQAWSSKAEKEVVEVEKQYQEGAITKGERYNKVIAIWSKVTNKVGR
jgi:DNA-directed RNA polymerase subunit beta'